MALVAVLLPGSGSDDVFVRAAFGPALAARGIALQAPPPRPGSGVVAGYRAALDEAARAGGPLLVGGVSLGAHVAAAWAARTGAACGLLLALPAWGSAADGTPDGAPAAAAARLTAAQVRSGGLAGAVAAARSGAPGWLADELARAWTGYGDGLADALDAAATTPGPTPAALRSLAVPVGVVGVRDDPVHPLAEARRWSDLLPRAALAVLDLAALGADPAAVGTAALGAWEAAAARG